MKRTLSPDELEDPMPAGPPRKAFRVDDVVDPRFYDQHRDDILEAMSQGLVLRAEQDTPAGVQLVSREVSTFTRAQLREPGFYDEHRDEIFDALKEGRITE